MYSIKIILIQFNVDMFRLTYANDDKKRLTMMKEQDETVYRH